MRCYSVFLILSNRRICNPNFTGKTKFPCTNQVFAVAVWTLTHNANGRHLCYCIGINHKLQNVEKSFTNHMCRVCELYIYFTLDRRSSGLATLLPWKLLLWKIMSAIIFERFDSGFRGIHYQIFSLKTRKAHLKWQPTPQILSPCKICVQNTTSRLKNSGPMAGDNFEGKGVFPRRKSGFKYISAQF